MLQRIKPGGELILNSQTWGHFADATEHYMRTRERGDPGQGLRLAGVEPSIIKIRNETGANLLPGEVCDVATAITADLDPTLIWLTGAATTAEGVVGVALRAIPDGDPGDVVVVGVCVAKVTITDASHRFAHVVPGEAVLTSSRNGPVRILHAGEETSIVLLTQICLPPQLLRDVVLTETQLIKHVWFTDQPCDEYVPYVLANLNSCYVPYTPADDPDVFDTEEEWDQWTGFQHQGVAPWTVCEEDGNWGACFSPNGDEGVCGEPGEYCIEFLIETGPLGGYFQFDYLITDDLTGEGYGPLTAHVGSFDVFSESGSTGGDYAHAGPFAFIGGGVWNIRFCIDGTGTSWNSLIARIRNVTVWVDEP